MSSALNVRRETLSRREVYARPGQQDLNNFIQIILEFLCLALNLQLGFFFLLVFNKAKSKAEAETSDQSLPLFLESRTGSRSPVEL